MLRENRKEAAPCGVQPFFVYPTLSVLFLCVCAVFCGPYSVPSASWGIAPDSYCWIQPERSVEAATPAPSDSAGSGIQAAAFGSKSGVLDDFAP